MRAERPVGADYAVTPQAHGAAATLCALGPLGRVYRAAAVPVLDVETRGGAHVERPHLVFPVPPQRDAHRRGAIEAAVHGTAHRVQVGYLDEDVHQLSVPPGVHDGDAVFARAGAQERPPPGALAPRDLRFPDLEIQHAAVELGRLPTPGRADGDVTQALGPRHKVHAERGHEMRGGVDLAAVEELALDPGR